MIEDKIKELQEQKENIKSEKLKDVIQNKINHLKETITK